MTVILTKDGVLGAEQDAAPWQDTLQVIGLAARECHVIGHDKGVNLAEDFRALVRSELDRLISGVQLTDEPVEQVPEPTRASL